MAFETKETISTKGKSRMRTCDPQMAQKTMIPASFGEILFLQKGEKQKLFHCQNGARNPIKEFNVEVTNI